MFAARGISAGLQKIYHFHAHSHGTARSFPGMCMGSYCSLKAFPLSCHCIPQKGWAASVAQSPGKVFCFISACRSIWICEPCTIKLVQPFGLGRRDLLTQSELLIQFAGGNLTESLTWLLLSLYVGLQG